MTIGSGALFTFSEFLGSTSYTSLCGAMTASFSREDPSPFEKEVVMTYTGNFQT